MAAFYYRSSNNGIANSLLSPISRFLKVCANYDLFCFFMKLAIQCAGPIGLLSGILIIYNVGQFG